MTSIQNWKTLLFGHKGSHYHQDKNIRSNLISQLSKTNPDGSFTDVDCLSDNNCNLLINSFTFFITSVFEKNQILAKKNEAYLNILRKNKVDYDIELDKKKKAVYDLEIKVNNLKKKLKENIHTNTQHVQQIETLKAGHADNRVVENIFVPHLNFHL